MHFSTFTSYLAQNRTSIPASLYSQVRREGIARLQERLSAGRADCELTFDDLIRLCEASIAGK